MPRVRHAPAARRRKKKVFKRAKGFRGGRSKLLRTAKETVFRALAYATRDRKLKKRSFRQLWTIRLNAACREHNLSYSQVIDGLKKAHIDLNRKMLSELAVREPHIFKKVIETVKSVRNA